MDNLLTDCTGLAQAGVKWLRHAEICDRFRSG
jgi:hypothetical protein